MKKIGSKFIDGKMINLDNEPIEKLEVLAKKIQECENLKRDQLDDSLKNMINEE